MVIQRTVGNRNSDSDDDIVLSGGVIMADMLIPILVIIIMYFVISTVEEAFTLGMIALLFAGVSYVFMFIGAGAYDTLFGADVSAIATLPLLLNLITGSMITIPAYALIRISLMRRDLKKANEAKAAESEVFG
jgi:sensor histidine kinase YesM